MEDTTEMKAPYAIEYLTAASGVWAPVTRTDASTGFRTVPLTFDTLAEAERHVADMIEVGGWRGLRVKPRWTFEGYRNAVLGTSSAATIVAAFELDASDGVGMDAWLGEAESEACSMGGIDLPAEWAEYHAIALRELCAVGVDG